MSQEPSPHDGVGERAAERDVRGSPQPGPALSTPTPAASAPEVRAASEEATGKLPHLVLPRHFARAGIGGPRLFSCRPPLAHLTGTCARAVSWRCKARDRWVSVAGRLDPGLCQTNLDFPAVGGSRGSSLFLDSARQPLSGRNQSATPPSVVSCQLGRCDFGRQKKRGISPEN